MTAVASRLFVPEQPGFVRAGSDVLLASAEASAPAIRFGGSISLDSFQDCVEAQWNMRPSAITSVYVRARNEIYLDDSVHEPSFGRTLDDMLAHEMTHYVQAVYFGALESNLTEDEAVDVKLWCRETYAPRQQIGP